MRLALNEARKALQLQEVPIGAVVVADGAVVGRGHNLVETLSVLRPMPEMQALTAAASTLGGKYLQGCTLYVTVEPCIMVRRSRRLGAGEPRGVGRRRPEEGLQTLFGDGVPS